MEKQLCNLSKKLKRKATIERKRIGNDFSHYEGMCKGLWLAYEEAAKEIDRIIKANR